MKFVLSVVLVFSMSGLSFGQSSGQSDNRPPVSDHDKDRLGDGGAGSAIEEMPEPSAANDAESKAAVEEAKLQLAGMCELNGDLWNLCSKKAVRGEFVVDLTIQGKGKVVTVFMVSSTAEKEAQITLKNKLIELQFPNIKLPKNKRVKFRYTLNLNC